MNSNSIERLTTLLNELTAVVRRGEAIRREAVDSRRRRAALARREATDSQTSRRPTQTEIAAAYEAQTRKYHRKNPSEVSENIDER
jgi:hypothetical protein